MNNRKLMMLYTFWTGDDVGMLIRSIKHHKDHVDKIVVFIQELSNTGEYQSINDARLMNHEEDDECLFQMCSFTPDLSKNTKENERVKHNRMIQYAKMLGATHFILSASDHFYSSEMFEIGKGIMDLDRYSIILTKMRTFYKKQNWILDPPEDYYMPFICKMYPNTEISKTVKYPVTVDPSVKVYSGNNLHNAYIMPFHQGYMDHYSMVRKDIQKKFRNAASSIRWKPEQVETFISEYENAKPGDSITYFQGRKIVEI